MSDEYIRKAEAIKQCGFGMTSLHIADNLRKMRPADVVPVVHGHWEYIDDTYCGFEDTDVRCSVCKTTTNIKRFRKTKWCPDCGAKMDAQGEE